MSYILLRFTTEYANRCGITSIQKSGFYGNPLQFCIWVKQVVHWVSLILLQRTILGIFFYALKAQLKDFGDWVLEPVADDNTAKIILVVVLWPPITAVAEFWIQDNFLKEGGGCYCCTPQHTGQDASQQNEGGGVSTRAYEKVNYRPDTLLDACLDIPMQTFNRMFHSHNTVSYGDTQSDRLLVTESIEDETEVLVDPTGWRESRTDSLRRSLSASAGGSSVGSETPREVGTTATEKHLISSDAEIATESTSAHHEAITGRSGCDNAGDGNTSDGTPREVKVHFM